MARPVKAQHEKRAAQLPPIRVTVAELAYVEQQALNAGLSITEYIRVLSLTEEVKPRKTKLDASFLVELNRIGVNLNQIAHASNIGRDDQNILRYAIDELVALMAKLNKGLS